jgi:Tol biopolymer transport system component
MNARFINYWLWRFSLFSFLIMNMPDAVAQTYTPSSLHNGPSWSPNGYEIAYSAIHQGRYDIFTIDIWTQERYHVSAHPANDLYPAWSPDGDQIAYYSDRPNTIGPFPPDTIIYRVKGLYETYARDGYRPSWSSDGRTIAAHFRGERGNYEIYLMNRFGRERRPITENEATDVHPKFSKDGSKIAFVSDRDYQPEIYIMNSDGSHQQRLTFSASYDLDPDWSPDGTKIAFISNREGFFNIYLLNLENMELEKLTDSPSTDIAPVWSPDGSKILFSSNRYGYFDLFVINVDGTGLTRLTDTEAHQYYGSWSPGGSRIAYLSTEKGEPHLFIMNANGSRKRQLTR